LALVFFDDRHLEPGALRDTLKPLVATKIYQKECRYVSLYILNHINAGVSEDNAEDIVV